MPQSQQTRQGHWGLTYKQTQHTHKATSHNTYHKHKISATRYKTGLYKHTTHSHTYSNHTTQKQQPNKRKATQDANPKQGKTPHHRITIKTTPHQPIKDTNHQPTEQNNPTQTHKATANKPTETPQQNKTHHSIHTQPATSTQRIATWNIHHSYNPTNLAIACIKAKIDYLACQEPGLPYTQTNTPMANAAHNIMQIAGYTMHVSEHLLTITNDYTITPATHTTPIQDTTGRMQAQLITHPTSTPTLIIAVYAHQRGHTKNKTHNSHKNNKEHNNPAKALKEAINQTIQKHTTTHPNHNTIILGDLQHTLNNTMHRTTPLLPPPPHDILTLGTNKWGLVSIIPHVHPTRPYLTRTGRQGSAGIDHILTKTTLINPQTVCGTDHTHTTQLIKSDHALIFADIPIIPTATAHKPTHTTKYHYKQIDQIPIKMPNTTNKQGKHGTSQTTTK